MKSLHHARVLAFVALGATYVAPARAEPSIKDECVAAAEEGQQLAFGVAGRNQLDDLHACKPNCPSSDVSALQTDMATTDISLGVGVLAAGFATWFYLTRPTIFPPSARAAAGLVVW